MTIPEQHISTEETQSISETDAWSTNAAAGRAVGETVRTTLGPCGMNKLLVDDAGMAIVTNDGASILKEMDIVHPAANTVVRAAFRQEDAIGDGTTTVAVLASSFLDEAESLLERGLHPTTIVDGFSIAATEVTERLRMLALDAADDTLGNVIETALTNKLEGQNHRQLVETIVEAVRGATLAGTSPSSHVRVATEVGGHVADSQLLKGGILKKERANADMPYLVEDATVAVIDGAIEPKVGDSTVEVSDASTYDGLLSAEKTQVLEAVDRLATLGVDAVITEGNIDPRAQQWMVDHQMYGARRQSPDDLKFAARATGATAVGSVGDLTADDLGRAGVIAERVVDGEQRTTIEDVPVNRAATLLLTAGTRKVVEEIHRSVEDTLGAAESVLNDDRVVPGGGAAEAASAAHLRGYAPGVGHRMQFAITAYADALEIVPRTLVQNIGMHGTDVITELRRRHSRGDHTAGVSREGEVVDLVELGVYDPLSVKTTAIMFATEVVIALLRVDGIVAADGLEGGWITNEPNEDEKIQYGD